MELFLISYIVASLIFGWIVLLLWLSSDPIPMWFSYREIKEEMAGIRFTKFGSIMVGVVLVLWNLCMIPWIISIFLFMIGKKVIIKDIKEK
jgi:hypothetical protein